jgi:hypothetical protein
MAQEARLQRHRTWQKYAEREIAAGRKPVKFKDYQLESTYFRGVSKQTAESRMKAAGIDWEKDKPSARLQRSKKGK